MEKIILKFLVLICFLGVYPTLVFANTSEEIEINNLYKRFYSIANTSEIGINNLPKIDKNKVDEAMDCIIEIYKKKPNSMEAYYATCLMKNLLIKSTVNKKYYEMKEKHLPNLNDPNFETAEKLIFLWTMTSSWSASSSNEANTNYQMAMDAFNNVKENCNNKNYAVLAAVALSFDSKKFIECKKYIVNENSDYLAVPCIKGEIAFYENTPDYNKCIDELQKLVDKYGSIKTPGGWRMALEYYCFIAHAYVKMGDYSNAKKYFDIIVKEDSNYWNLRFLKSALSDMNNSDSK